MQSIHTPQTDCSSPPTRVTVVGYRYLVDFGPSVNPRFHLVNKQRRCSCEDDSQRGEALLNRSTGRCSAINAVAEYLRHGGLRAPDPLPACPICGAETVRDRKWDGRYTRELGWRCLEGGIAHFLQAKAHRIRAAQQRRETSAGNTGGNAAAQAGLT